MYIKYNVIDLDDNTITPVIDTFKGIDYVDWCKCMDIEMVHSTDRDILIPMTRDEYENAVNNLMNLIRSNPSIICIDNAGVDIDWETSEEDIEEHKSFFSKMQEFNVRQ